jgi:hypothetical protein
MAQVVNFSLNPSADRDIIRWLDEQPNRSAAIRAAIRAYMAKEKGVTLADVLVKLHEMTGEIRTLKVAGTQPEAEEAPEGEEPAAAAANVDSLLDRLDSGDWD